MQFDRDTNLLYFTEIVFIGFLYSIIFNSSSNAYLASILALLLIFEILFQVYDKIRRIHLFVCNNSDLVIPYIFLPLVYVLFFELGFILYPKNDFKTIILNIYTLYITITTVFLSVAFVIIAFFSNLEKRTKYSTKFKKQGINAINHFFLIYSVGAIGLTLIAYVMTNFVPSDQIYPHYIGYFLISSFFVVGTIFGIMRISSVFTGLSLLQTRRRRE